MSLETVETFALHVGCMDGRIQDPVKEYIQQKFQTDNVDVITDAGIVGRIARIKREGIANEEDKVFKGELSFKVIDVSLSAHDVKGIVVSGHEDCAVNQVGNQQQEQDIRDSVIFIREMVNDKVLVQGVIVVKDQASNWQVKEVPQTLIA